MTSEVKLVNEVNLPFNDVRPVPTKLLEPIPEGAQTIGSVRVDQSKNAVPKRYQIVLTLPGSAAAGTNLGGVRKQAAGAVVRIKRIEVLLAHNGMLLATGKGNPLSICRAASVAGGTPIAAADIPKRDTMAPNATLEVRTGAVTGTKAAQRFWVGGTNSVAAQAQTGAPSVWQSQDLGDDIVLRGDEGLIFEQGPLDGDADDRYLVCVSWEEE